MEVNFSTLFNTNFESPLNQWLESVKPLVEAQFDTGKNGNLQKWLDALNNIKNPGCNSLSVESGYLSFKTDEEISENLLKEFMPWRKGPWIFGNNKIDTEWHSDWKWERLERFISPVKGRTILDVGCGNGYHCYRMALSGAKAAVGIDPGMLSVMQAQIAQNLSPETPAWVLPIGIESMPHNSALFDTIFSMGVLYHRKSPIDHLFHLKELLNKGGELVLETLVVDKSYGDMLIPEGRYAKMRNVWFIPSVDILERMVSRAGFTDIKTVDVTDTSLEEQRTTEWMDFESLPNFLDSTDISKTVEGYPAPKRAVLIARKP